MADVDLAANHAEATVPEELVSEKDLVEKRPSGSSPTGGDRRKEKRPSGSSPGLGLDGVVAGEGGSGGALDDSLENLASQWEGFAISRGIEDGVVLVADGPADPGGQGPANRGGWCLAGSLQSIRGGGPKLIEKAMTAAWKLLKPMTMEIVEENLLAFRFESELDYKKVLREGPWRFDDFLMAFKEVEAVMPSREEINSVPFWVQVFGLPAKWQNERMIRYVGSLLGVVMDADPTVRRLDGTRELFLRVRVELSLLQELPRGTVLRYGKEAYPLAFKFERLPNFCFYCGFVDHVVMDCEKMVEEKKSVADCTYGLWLRGYAPKGMHPGMMGGVSVGLAPRNPFARPTTPASRSLASLASRANQVRLAPPPGFQPIPVDSRVLLGGTNPFTFRANASRPSLALPSYPTKPKAPVKGRPRKKTVAEERRERGDEERGRDEEIAGSRKKKRAAVDAVDVDSSSAGVRDHFPDPIME